MGLTRKSSQPRKTILPATAPDLPDSASTDLKTWFVRYKDSIATDKETIEAAFAELDGQNTSLLNVINALSARIDALEVPTTTSDRWLVFDANVAPTAAIKESKLALNFATHSNSQDPSGGEKAALIGTFGAPSGSNRYVTDSDPRLLNPQSTSSSVPVGAIVLYPGATVPDGWLECIGQSLLRSQYPNLFAVLGTTWGAVDADHFTLPDGRGRSPMGDGTGTGLTVRTLASYLGEEDHLLVGAESGMPAHSHTVPWRDNTCQGGSDNSTGTMTDGPDITVATSTTGPVDASEGHNTVHPVFVCRYIIKS